MVAVNSRPLHPPEAPLCKGCGEPMSRVYGCQIDTSGCKDHDEIPPEKRVLDLHDRRPEHIKEAAFQRHIDERRKVVAEAGQNPNGMRQTHSVPADLFHGKIRETGDKKYWDDPKNLKKHKSTEVS